MRKRVKMYLVTSGATKLYMICSKFSVWNATPQLVLADLSFQDFFNNEYLLQNQMLRKTEPKVWFTGFDCSIKMHCACILVQLEVMANWSSTAQQQVLFSWFLVSAAFCPAPGALLWLKAILSERPLSLVQQNPERQNKPSFSLITWLPCSSSTHWNWQSDLDERRTNCQSLITRTSYTFT